MHDQLYRVWRLLYIDGAWVDGPVEIMDWESVVEFNKTHTHYKVMEVREEKPWGRKRPSIFSSEK